MIREWESHPCQGRRVDNVRYLLCSRLANSGETSKKGGWIPIRPFKGHRATLTWMMVSIHQSSCRWFTLETTDFFLQNSREFSSRNIPGLYLEQGNGIQTSQTPDLHPSFLVLPLCPSPHGEKHETLCMRFFRLMLCAMGNEGFRLAVIHTGMLETNQNFSWQPATIRWQFLGQRFGEITGNRKVPTSQNAGTPLPL